MQWSKSSDYSIDSDCKRYRISRGRSGSRWVYHLWSRKARTYLYACEASGWRCVSIHDSAAEAKQAARDHRAQRAAESADAGDHGASSRADQPGGNG